MNQEFIKAVEERKVRIVRMMLSNELLLDPRGNTFGEMLEYAKDKMENLFEPNEPARFDIPANKEEWTDEVVSKMKRDLNMNFSIEKLLLFAEMAKWSGRDKAQKLDEENPHGHATSSNLHNEKDKIGTTKAPRTNKHNAVCRNGSFVTVGGAILTIVGICAGKTLITILGGGMVVIGGVVLMTTRKK